MKDLQPHCPSLSAPTGSCRCGAGVAVIALCLALSTAVAHADFFGFPILVNPVGELLTGVDVRAEAGMGSSVSVFGDTVAVGAPGVDAVLVFHRNPGASSNQWGTIGSLQPTSPQTGSWFGWSVSLGDGFLIVGAREYNHDSITVNSGAAYIFERDGVESWGQVAELRADVPEAHARFGYAVSYSGQRVAIGAPGEGGHGVVYIFARNSGGVADSWSLIKKIPNPAGDDGAGFGAALSLWHDRLLVGAQANHGHAGAAYLFERNWGGMDTWGQVAELDPGARNAGDQFGLSVALSADIAVVGANGDDDKASDAGAAFVFGRNAAGGVPDSWGLVAKLTAPDATESARFGESVATWNDYVVVGAPAAPIDGEPHGLTYLFFRNRGAADAWGCAARMASRYQRHARIPGELYGYAVATWNGRIVIGAPSGGDPVTGVADTGAAFLREIRKGSFAKVAELANPEPTGAVFGKSLALWNDTMLVGSGHWQTGPTGRVYVHERNTGGKGHWGQVRELASPGEATFSYGEAVALHGSIAAVSDPMAGPHGEIYMFARNALGPDAWQRFTTIPAPDSFPTSSFGSALDMDGRFLVATTIGSNSGLHIFERNKTGIEGWGRVVSKRIPPVEEIGATYLPGGVALRGDLVAVGAPRFSEVAIDGGTVLLYQRNKDGADVWEMLQRLWPEGVAAGDLYGTSVDVSGDTRRGVNLAVGAPGDDEAGVDAGAVYIHQREIEWWIPGKWPEVAKILPPSGISSFGEHLKLCGSTLVATGRDGPRLYYFVFERNEGFDEAWGEVDRIDARPDSPIYQGLAFHGRTLAIGLPGQDSGAGRAEVYYCKTVPLLGLEAVAVGRSKSGVQMSWLGLAGVYYTVEASSTMKRGDWHALPGCFRMPGEEKIIDITDQSANGSPQRFYRLVGEVEPFAPQQ